MSLSEPPFEHPVVDLETGRLTLPWIDYFSFWKEVNAKVGALSNYTPGNIAKISPSGGIEDSGSGFAISRFSAYDKTGDITLGTGTWTDLTWDTDTWEDSDFYHDDDNDAADVTCKFNGKVDVTLYGTLYVSSYVNVTQTECKIQIYKNEWEDAGGLLSGLTFSSASQRLNFTVTQSIEVNNGDKIKAVASATSGSSTIKTIADACGIKIERKL